MASILWESKAGFPLLPRTEDVAISLFVKSSPISFRTKEEAVGLSLTAASTVWAGRYTPSPSTSSTLRGGLITASYQTI